MSAYDDAVAYLDDEVHPRCDYDVYRYMRDIVDEMEHENAKLREQIEVLRAENGRLKRFAKLDENTIDVLHSCIEDLNEETAKLRDELGQWHRLTAGIELPEYPIAEFRPKDLERENAKLRELVADMWCFTGAACKKYQRLFDPAAQGGQMVQLNMIDAFEQRMRDIGIEVE